MITQKDWKNLKRYVGIQKDLKEFNIPISFSASDLINMELAISLLTNEAHTGFLDIDNLPAHLEKFKSDIKCLGENIKDVLIGD